MYDGKIWFFLPFSQPHFQFVQMRLIHFSRLHTLDNGFCEACACDTSIWNKIPSCCCYYGLQQFFFFGECFTFWYFFDTLYKHFGYHLTTPNWKKGGAYSFHLCSHSFLFHTKIYVFLSSFSFFSKNKITHKTIVAKNVLNILFPFIEKLITIHFYLRIWIKKNFIENELNLYVSLENETKFRFMDFFHVNFAAILEKSNTLFHDFRIF